jgi:hypothetical protein
MQEQPWTAAAAAATAAVASQFAWLEAARAGGYSGKLFVGQHLQQLDGEVTLDALPEGGDSLPHIPGGVGCKCFVSCEVSVGRGATASFREAEERQWGGVGWGVGEKRDAGRETLCLLTSNRSIKGAGGGQGAGFHAYKVGRVKRKRGHEKPH